MIQKGTVTAMTLQDRRFSTFPVQVSNEVTIRTNPLIETLSAVHLAFAALLIAAAE
jgi:ABC-type spermidine/putrescine transport system permease subunit II